MHENPDVESHLEEDESETFVPITLNEQFAIEMKEKGINALAIPIGTLELEREEYYNNDYDNSPRLITNKGCVKIQNSDVEIIQLIQLN
jgi:aryl-phospho-beta-D-glucosidase BglC (GH1 family)